MDFTSDMVKFTIEGVRLGDLLGVEVVGCFDGVEVVGLVEG